MLGRALNLATVTLLIGCWAIWPARAQNLEAGKSPSQIFAGTCTACHKAPRGLLRTVQPGSLPGFLRQHYTTGGEMAALLSAYLISNGATDRRNATAPPSVRPGATTQEASRPDADGSSPNGRQGRQAKRPGDPNGATPGAEGQSPAQAASERGPDGRKQSAKQRLGSRGKPVTEEPPKTDDAPRSDPAKEGAPGAPDQPAEAKSAAVKTDMPNGETGAGNTPLRVDPVPSVTPAPAPGTSEVQLPPVQAIDAGPSTAPAPSATASTGASQMAVEPPPYRPSVPPPVPARTASAPPEPVTPAGPPSPPISQ
jgi:hypothetical protein